MLLKNKKILITGLANKYSIAAGIASAMHREGAELAFTYQNERLLKNLKPLAEETCAECGSFLYAYHFFICAPSTPPTPRLRTFRESLSKQLRRQILAGNESHEAKFFRDKIQNIGNVLKLNGASFKRQMDSGLPNFPIFPICFNFILLTFCRPPSIMGS